MTIKPGQIAAALDPDFLNLILLPTEGCNFRCTYCYQSFEIGRMARPVIDAVKAFITRRAPTLKALQVSWFGGEPLLAKQIIYEISAHAQTFSQLVPISYIGDMTTNGYLLDYATVERLIKLGIPSYQISLDGPEAIHNRTRVKANGSGSFSQIWSNLLALRDSHLVFSIMLRIHFSPHTVLALDPLIDDINREFGGDSRFSIYFKSVERLGGANDKAIRLFSERMQDEAHRYLDGKLSYKSQAFSLATDEPYICYASKPHSLVIRANGDVAKCTVALYDTRNKIGILRSNGTISVNQAKLHRWMRGFGALDEHELACPYSVMNIEVKRKQDREEDFDFGASRLEQALPSSRPYGKEL